MARTTASFASKIARPAKRTVGRGGVTETPLNVRAGGTRRDAELDDYVRRKLGRKLRKFATRIERVSVRFDDVNGPRGGIDIVSRIKVVVSGVPSIIVEERGSDAQHAFDLASHGTERAVRRSLERAGVTAGRARSQRSGQKQRTPAAHDSGAAYPKLPGGSLIGRRVGRSAANVERARAWDPTADTSRPGVSASDRKAGRGSSAARNVKRQTSRATATLEDSATGRPSRKSTRKSANRTKAGTKQARRARLRTNSAKQRALRRK